MTLALTSPLQRSSPAHDHLSALPLWFCYVVIPAPLILSSNAGLTPLRALFDVALVAGAALAIVVMALTQRVRVFRSADIWFALVTLAIGYFLLRMAITMTGRDIAFSLALMELKPLFYIALAALSLFAFGPPRGEDFIKCGVLLAWLLIGDLLFRTVTAGALTRAVGAGEVNYDGALIILSLCFALSDVRRHRVAILILFLGLLASMSRTGIAAALLIILLTSRISIQWKIAACVFGVAAAIFSFTSREQSITQLATLDRVWMWIVGLQLFADQPEKLFWGFGTGIALPVSSVPAPIAQLWADQQVGKAVPGIFPYQLHAFWLRAVASWGLIPVLVALLMLLAPVARDEPILAFRLLLFIALLGLTMGLFYLSNLAVPLLLACAVVDRRPT
jgi:hypothetical protein